MAMALSHFQFGRFPIPLEPTPQMYIHQDRGRSLAGSAPRLRRNGGFIGKRDCDALRILDDMPVGDVTSFLINDKTGSGAFARHRAEEEAELITSAVILTTDGLTRSYEIGDQLLFDVDGSQHRVG